MRNRERAWAAVDEERLAGTLETLVDVYSPSGKEEDVQLCLEAMLTEAGLAVERQPLEEEEERYNLRATFDGGEPDVYLVGHVDTVAAWDLEAFGSRWEGDVLYGLGSADMKGGCAAMVEAFQALCTLPRGERPDAGLLLVVGEEENGDGSSRFLEDRRPAWVVIGEPTGLSACFAHYGYLEAGFVTRGRRSHSSLPELGSNAVEAMLRLLLHLGRDPRFRREESDLVYSIRELSSSQAGFVVPDRCESWIDLHLPPGTDPGELERTIRTLADEARSLVPELDLELLFDFATPGYDLGAANPPGELLQGIYPQLGLSLHFDAFRSHSDGNLFRQAEVNPIILGPGRLETAHTPEEQTTLAQVADAARIYAALALGMG